MPTRRMTTRRPSTVFASIWTDVDDAAVVAQLVHEKEIGNQSGAGWKKPVWAAIQKVLAEKGSKRGAEKTTLKCSDHWANVRVFLFPLLLQLTNDTIIAQK
jgi:hypothetical protein